MFRPHLTDEDFKRIGRIGRWAPGSYTGKCSDCGGEITGDKRSSQCFVCAVIAMKECTTKKSEAKIFGMKFQCDPSLEPGVIEFHHPSGKVDRFKVNT